MQATLDGYGLKPFTKALNCLSRYGDDLTIYATPEFLAISATNSSMSAYCRFKYNKQFFARFNVGSRRRGDGDEVEEATNVTGQLLTKSLLSILKHRTVEKTVDRCELSIIDGPEAAEQDEERDTLESVLVVRLYCKHGITKTHRLLLLTDTSLMTPGIPDVPHESRLTIGPKAIKAIIEHFPLARGPKSDPQLIWRFRDSEVDIKSFDHSIDVKGNAQLSTEMTISADEFDVYNIHSPPITIAFHLKEFNATVAFAESMSLPLDLRFTDPASPLFIDIEADGSDILFVISTSLVRSSDAPAHQSGPGLSVKRKRDDQSVPPNQIARAQKPMKAAHRADAATVAAREESRMRDHPRSQSQGLAWTVPPSSNPQTHTQGNREPLFLPGSQASIANEEQLRASGLGLENMTSEELTALLEDDDQEVDFAVQRLDDNARRSHEGDETHTPVGNGQADDTPDSFELFDEPYMIATQSGSVDHHSKAFRPLFED